MARRSRLVARREDLGLSQKKLARLVDVGVSTVRRWESGGNLRSYQRRPLADALKVPLQPTPDGHDLDWYLVRDDEVDVDRRPAVDVAPQRQLPAEREQSDAAANVMTVLGVLGSSMDDDLVDRVDAVRSGRARIDVETLDGLGQVALGYRRAYRSASARSLLRPAHGTLSLLVELAPEAGDDQRGRLVSMIGQMGTLVGTMLMLDLGNFETARPYLAIAARAAHQIENAELMAFTLGCRAFHSTYSGHPTDGLAFADGSLELARRGIHPLTHGWLAAVASEMHATNHDALTCERLLDEAASHLQRLDPAEPWLGIGVFNDDKLVAYRGGDLVRLGRYREAQLELGKALDRLDPALRKHRATAYVDLAEAYVHDGKVDDGAEHASTALGIVAGTAHADSLRRVETIHAAIRHHQTPTVRRLGEQLLELKAAS